ncbi:MAG: alpha/beta hydrolase-fold protein [Psychrobium sp.]
MNKALNIGVLSAKFAGLVMLLMIIVSALIWWFPTLFVPLVSQPSTYQTQPISGVNMHCVDALESQGFNYCVNRSPDSASKRVIYHFHGRKGTARWWNDSTYYTGDVYRHWLELEADIPTVVSISFGPLWLFNHDSLHQLTTVIIPKIERELAFTVDERLVVGESMGGVNALTLWGQQTTKFDGVAALCPPLPMVSPYGGVGDLWQYFQHSTTSFKRGLMLLIMGRALYQDDAQWRSLDVLQQFEQGKFIQNTPLYLSCGKKDDWGCMEGALALLQKARDSEVDIQWQPREGGHCDIDTKSLAAFLIAEH